jgi:sorbitol-specific phosphotransferase system component IIBC
VNGVELTVTVAQALELFESPSDLINALFSNPRQVATAIMNIGADMTPVQRKQSQQAIVPAVVVTQIISGTAAVTMIKRTPISVQSTPSSIRNER